MGAAAFLMVEYVGISYVEVIKHAFLPAIISYIALVYIVHLEACKMGLVGMKRRVVKTLAQKLLSFVMTILFIIIIGGATYYGLGWIKTVAGSASIFVVSGLLAVSYFVLLWVACKVPELPVSHDIDELPDFGSTAQAGYYFLLPIVVLMWCLTVERLSPSLSAYWATMLLIVIVLTQRPLKGFLRKATGDDFTFKRGFDEFVNGLVSGARNMIGIG
ncbi:MAG: TRAP transporter large permease subunit, partial [Desulfobacteraceae bacterium]|nr:TRAP transporter large permease subunit [Desulfobacteraceae bacterium]